MSNTLSPSKTMSRQQGYRRPTAEMAEQDLDDVSSGMSGPATSGQTFTDDKGNGLGSKPLPKPAI
jgi:hypothetical protein